MHAAQQTAESTSSMASESLLFGLKRCSNGALRACGAAFAGLFEAP